MAAEGNSSFCYSVDICDSKMKKDGHKYKIFGNYMDYVPPNRYLDPTISVVASQDMPYGISLYDYILSFMGH